MVNVLENLVSCSIPVSQYMSLSYDKMSQLGRITFNARFTINVPGNQATSLTVGVVNTDAVVSSELLVNVLAPGFMYNPKAGGNPVLQFTIPALGKDTEQTVTIGLNYTMAYK